MRSGHNARTVADRLGRSNPGTHFRVYTHDTDDQAIAAGRVPRNHFRHLITAHFVRLLEVEWV